MSPSDNGIGGRTIDLPTQLSNGDNRGNVYEPRTALRFAVELFELSLKYTKEVSAAS